MSEIEKTITEEDVRGLLNNFNGYVITRNISECKKFTTDFIKEVIIYKEHIEVIVNMSFSLFKNNDVVGKLKDMNFMKGIAKAFV